MTPARDVRLITLLLIAAGALAIGINASMLTRIRIPESDEVFFISASKSLADGGQAVAWLNAPIRAMSQEAFYGPVWFRLQAAIIRYAGVSMYAARGLSLFGMVLMAVACAVAIRAAGASWPWAAAGFALALWAPEIHPAINGRMDTLAVAGVLFGWAAYVSAVRRQESSSAVLFAVIGGAAFACAVLTTPRVAPITVAIAAASPLLILFGYDWRRVAGVLAIQASSALVFASLGLMASGLTWTGWVMALGEGGSGTTDVSPLFGGRWITFRPNASRALPLPIFCAALAGIALLRSNPPRARGMVVFGLGVATYTTALTALLFSDPWVRSVQFASCWTITALLAASTLLKDRGRQAAIAFGIVALGCVGFRMHRYIEVAQSWAKRDPQPVADFFRAHVPAGSVVYTTWTYYYALHAAGARPEAYRIRDQPIFRPHRDSEAVAWRGPRFLVIPDLDEDLTLSLPLARPCAKSNRIAVFEPAPMPTDGLLARIPIFVRPEVARGYTRAYLYQLPDDCEIN